MSPPINFIEDIQYTDNLDDPTLVREINFRTRDVNDNFGSVAVDLETLRFLATTKTFEVSYQNSTDIPIFEASIDLYVTGIALRAPINTMTVVPGISVLGAGPFTPVLLDPDIPLSEIPVTSTAETYVTLAEVAGGNADMSRGDVFQVQTSNGTQNNPLYITIQFDIIGLTETNEMVRANLISSALITL